MTTLSVKEQWAPIATEETSVTYGFDFTDRLDADANETIASATSRLYNKASPEFGDIELPSPPDPGSPFVYQQVDGSKLTAQCHYRLIVVVTTSTGRTEAADLELRALY
jgi:hypothetical protein